MRETRRFLWSLWLAVGWFWKERPRWIRREGGPGERGMGGLLWVVEVLGIYPMTMDMDIP